VAYLYRADLALPKRQATPAQRAAIAKALLARRTCPTCGTGKPYYIPRSLGECLDCTGR
jgi:rubredoxin